MSAELLTQRIGPTMVLTMSDPASRNALSPTIYAGIVEALQTAADDDAVRAVVLTGAGGHFCAGGHLQRLLSARSRSADEQRAAIDGLHGLIDSLRSLPKPVIAAVEGAAAGAGCSLTLACDLIVAGRGARFVLSYGRVGLTPDGGATWLATRALPAAVVREWVWLAEPMSAERLQTLGVVNRVVDDGSAVAQATQLAERLATMAPNAVAAGKALLNQAQVNSLREQLDAEREAFVAQLFHDNGGEGIAAFHERRSPRFR